MKTRNGFVSNSSSCSFIVSVNEEPRSASHLHNMLFPRGEETIDGFSSKKLAERVFNDIKTDGMTLNGLVESVRYSIDPPDIVNDLDNNGERVDWVEYSRRELMTLRRSIVKKLNELDGFVFSCEYEDHESLSIVLHDGLAFVNVKTIKINNH